MLPHHCCVTPSTLTIPACGCRIAPHSPQKWISAMVTHTASRAKEAPMSDPASNPESSQQDPSRRRFLKGGVALGAALVAGAGPPIAGRAQPAPDDPSKVLGSPLRPYGERSPFEQQVRVTQAKPAER